MARVGIGSLSVQTPRPFLALTPFWRWPAAQTPAVGDRFYWALPAPHPDSGPKILHCGGGAGFSTFRALPPFIAGLQGEQRSFWWPGLFAGF